MTSLLTPPSHATPGPSGVSRLPQRREKADFRRTAWLTAWGFTGFAAIALPFGTATGTLTWAPTADRLFATIAVALLLPALGEELLFRAPLIRWPNAWLAAALCTAYVLWHPLLALSLLPAAREVFLSPSFLAIVALFGILATALTIHTRRLWPSVLCHWVMVVGWKQLLGGEQFVGGG